MTTKGDCWMGSRERGRGRARRGSRRAYAPAPERREEAGRGNGRGRGRGLGSGGGGLVEEGRWMMMMGSHYALVNQSAMYVLSCKCPLEDGDRRKRTWVRRERKGDAVRDSPNRANVKI